MFLITIWCGFIKSGVIPQLVWGKTLDMIPASLPCLAGQPHVNYFVWDFTSQLEIVSRNNFRNVWQLCFVCVNRCQTKYQLNQGWFRLFSSKKNKIQIWELNTFSNPALSTCLQGENIFCLVISFNFTWFYFLKTFALEVKCFIWWLFFPAESSVNRTIRTTVILSQYQHKFNSEKTLKYVLNFVRLVCNEI